MSVSESELERPATMVVRNPATGESLGELATTPADQIVDVVDAVAQVQPLWGLLRLQDRARYVRRLAQAVIDQFAPLEDLLVREQGRPRAEIATLELLPALDALRWIADAGPGVLGQRQLSIHRSMFLAKQARVAYEPLGVIGVIGAGSAPFAQPIAQIAGALLAGNGVVFKPALRAGLAGEAIAGVLAHAGLPEGLVAIAHGGAPLGIALARSSLQKILFTGSPAVGHEIARICASENREVVVESGGKDAMLLASDAHIARAVSGALWASFAGAGQARGSVERIYVHHAVAERFTELLISKARALQVGDPLHERTQVGPLASDRRLQHVQELVAQALSEGAQLRCGGPLPAPDGCTGSFYAPAVLTDVNNQMRVMREPIDGPVVAVMEVASLEQAIELTNDCDYTLGASIWSSDRYESLRVAREVNAGMVWCNDHLPAPMISSGPWGATPTGGMGRTLGEAGLRACAREKLISWDPSGSRGLWWGPYGRSLTAAARTVAELRSGRDQHREHAWRHGTIELARVGVRALRHRDGR